LSAHIEPQNKVKLHSFINRNFLKEVDKLIGLNCYQLRTWKQGWFVLSCASHLFEFFFYLWII
jgi:hypothetical protein